MNADITAIHAEMDVVSADGLIVGVVDSVAVSELRLTQQPGWSSGHAVPLGFIRDVDDKVRLVVTEAEARRRWRETR